MTTDLHAILSARRFRKIQAQVPRKISDQNNMLLTIPERFPDLNLGVTKLRPDLPYYSDEKLDSMTDEYGGKK
jgi:hypothetical protein